MVLDEFAEPITMTVSASVGDLSQGRLSIRGGETEVAAARHPDVGKDDFGVLAQVLPLIHAQRGLAEQRDRPLVAGQSVDVVARLE